MAISITEQQFIDDLLQLPIFKGLPYHLFIRHLDHHKKQWDTEPKQYISEPEDQSEVAIVKALWAKHYPDRSWPK